GDQNRPGHQRRDRADARPRRAAVAARHCRRGDRMMRRREFIMLLGGAAAWPLAAGAQQPERMRRVGVHMNTVADDPRAQARLAAFVQGLRELGWTEGRNIRIDTRWGTAADIDSHRKDAAELVALAPDVILGTTTPSTEALQRATRTVPIVFAMVIDPV